MLPQLQARLALLKQEFMAGQTQLQELERQETSLRETLLKISAAIQVLEEELLAKSAKKPKDASDNIDNIIEK